MKRLFFASVCCSALLVACSKDDGGSNGQDAKSNVVAGTLAVDIRQTVDVALTPKGDGVNFDGTLTFGDGDFQYFDAQTVFHIAVAQSNFPEAQTSMYAATFSAPARASNPCADQPLSLALSLVRRGSNARVGGGVTIYCGEGETSGIPARVFRLTGDLPLP
jgi:hypothetical protein